MVDVKPGDDLMLEIAESRLVCSRNKADEGRG